MKPMQTHRASEDSALIEPTVTFADQAYLGNVIAFLRNTRLRNGLTVKTIARRAGVREGVVLRAENGGFIPKSDEFKSWSSALGYSWDEVWSECSKKALRREGQRKEHQTFAQR